MSTLKSRKVIKGTLITAAFLSTAIFSMPVIAEDGSLESRKATHSKLSINPAPIAFVKKTNAPLMIITSEDIPQSLKDKLYNRPIQTHTIKPEDITVYRHSPSPAETLVTRKVTDLNQNVNVLQSDVERMAGILNNIEIQSDAWAADYYTSIATINTQLQSGTTPGNPRLVSHLTTAERNLEELAQTLAQLNGLAGNASEASSQAAFLLEEARAAYSISGAIEEDHIELARLEDKITTTIIAIERILNNTSDDITRTTAYLNSERSNLRTLALAVNNGDMYGKSLSNHPFSSAGEYHGGAIGASYSPAQDDVSSPSTISQNSVSEVSLSAPKPLAKIRFDRADIQYEEPVYMAVNDALQRYPNARFDLVAVQPAQGNAAEVAIESTKARRNAERVLRTLTQMGLPIERIDLSYSKNANIAVNEVHLFVK